MNNSEHITFGDDASQTTEIVTLLEQILAEFDAMELAVPAIKIAEAIDCFKTTIETSSRPYPGTENIKIKKLQRLLIRL